MLNKAWGFSVLLVFAAAARASEQAPAELAGGHYLFQFSGSGLVDPYYVDGQGTAHPLDVADPAFQKAFAAGVDAVVDLPVDDPGLTLGGTVQGRVENDTISFDAKLSVVDDFTYSTGPVSATLRAGGGVSVSVEGNAFRSAALSLACEVDVTIKGQTLDLRGTIEGTIESDYDVSFEGSLTLDAPFVYEKGVVTATLAAGAAVQVTVEDDSFVAVTLGNGHLTANIDVPGTNGLTVGGSVEGKYRGDVLDLDASIDLKAPFTYERKGTKATLQAGPARLRIHDAKKAWVMISQPKHATLKLDLDDDDDTN